MRIITEHRLVGRCFLRLFIFLLLISRITLTKLEHVENEPSYSLCDKVKRKIRVFTTIMSFTELLIYDINVRKSCW